MFGVLNQISSGPWGIVVGAIVGVVASVVMEEQLLRLRAGWARRMRRLQRKVLTPLLGRRPQGSRLFSIGSIETPQFIVEGDGAQVIDEQRVSVIIDHRFAEPPDEVKAWVDEIAVEQARRKRDGEQSFWNGPSYAVAGLSITRSTIDELPEVCLRLQESDYFTFLATQQLDRPLADGTTLRGRYVEGRSPLEVPAFMSCSFGTNVAVVTADNQLILARRSQNVGSRPGVWSSSANEALSRQLDSDGRSAPDLYRVMRRGIDEELSLSKEEYLLELLAFSIDTELHQWGCYFVAFLRSVKGEEVLRRRGRGVPDKWENDELRLIPFETRSVFAFLAAEARQERLAPHLPALLYFALVRRYGRRLVERDEQRTFRR